MTNTPDQRIDEVLSRFDRLKTRDNPDGNPFHPGNLSQQEVKAALKSLIEAEATRATIDELETLSRVADDQWAWEAKDLINDRISELKRQAAKGEQ